MTGQVPILPFRSGQVTGLMFHLHSQCIGLSDNFIIILPIKCMVSFLISVLADVDLLKSVLNCLDLVVLSWKRDHPFNTKDGVIGWVVH